MVNLKISTIHIDPARNSAAIAEQLERTKKRRDISGVVFAGIAIDNVIANAAIDLFRHASRKGHGWSWLLLDDCTGRVDIMLHVATAIELFTEIAIENVPEISEQACLYISIGMKYNCSFPG
jgi:nicotinamidase-related amidase